MTNINDLLQYVQNDAFGNWLFPGYKTVNPVKYELKREAQHTHLACSAGVFFERTICSRKRHVETSRREEEMGRVKGLLFLLSPVFHCHKIKDGGYNNITNTNKVSPTQNTPALQAKNVVKNSREMDHIIISRSWEQILDIFIVLLKSWPCRCCAILHWSFLTISRVNSDSTYLISTICFYFLLGKALSNKLDWWKYSGRR